MMNMKRTFISVATVLLTAIQLLAATPDSVRYHHEATDTTCLTSIINNTRTAELESAGERIVFIARQWLGRPYVASTLEGESEMLTVNTSQYDCTTFVESVIALAMTTAEDTTTYRDYEKNLQSIRYRGGVIDGYSSRLHYVSDWVADNSERGNFVEVSEQFAQSKKQKLQLNYMTNHRRSYKALVDNAEEYAKMQQIEKRYNPSTYTYIPKQAMNNPKVEKKLQNGDIVLFTTTTPGLDVSHMGIVVMMKGRPHLLHASSHAKKVIIEPVPLQQYMAGNNKISGIRVVRMK